MELDSNYNICKTLIWVIVGMDFGGHKGGMLGGNLLVSIASVYFLWKFQVI